MATVKELRAEAKAYGIKGYSKLNKRKLEIVIAEEKLASLPRNTGRIIPEGLSTPSQPKASASTPATFTINPEVKPDYDAAFDEYAYSPDYQANRAVLDDEPQPRRLIIRRGTAPVARKFPTPKNPRGSVSDFSLCKNPEKLRKMLNAGSIDVVKSIAESYREFQPRTDGKPMTKKDYVTAIVKLYFPDYQPAPAKKSNTPTAEEIAQVRQALLAGKYGISFFDGITRDEATAYLYHYSCCNGYYSLKELHLITKALGIKILPTKEDMIYVLLNWMEDNGIIRASIVNPTIKPDYDASFDEAAYTPDVQEVSVIVDDIPADHEPDVQEVKPAPVQEAKPETTQAKTSTKFPRLERCPHCGSLHKPYFSYRKQNNYSYTRQHFGSDPSEWTVATLKCRDCGHIVDEYFEALYGQPFPSRQEAMKKVIGTWCLKSAMADRTTWKFKPAPAEFAPVSKSAPKPATRKPHHAKKLDNSRQILIQFNEPENMPDPTSEPAKLKAKRRPRLPRVKRDYSKQILIDFGENIPDGQTNQIQAA